VTKGEGQQKYSKGEGQQKYSEEEAQGRSREQKQEGLILKVRGRVDSKRAVCRKH
jgi:hypothetical protein